MLRPKGRPQMRGTGSHEVVAHFKLGGAPEEPPLVVGRGRPVRMVGDLWIAKVEQLYSTLPVH